MKVRTLIGRFAGQIIDMPYAIATACIANGTACLPDADHNVKGLPRASESVTEEPEKDSEPAETVDIKVNEEVKDAVHIPKNWRELPWFSQKSLAQKVSGHPVNNKPEAVKILADAEGN